MPILKLKKTIKTCGISELKWKYMDTTHIHALGIIKVALEYRKGCIGIQKWLQIWDNFGSKRDYYFQMGEYIIPMPYDAKMT